MKNLLLAIVFFCVFSPIVSFAKTKPVVYEVNINSEIGTTSKIYLLNTFGCISFCFNRFVRNYSEFCFSPVSFIPNRRKGIFRRVALIADLESSESVDTNDRNLVGQSGEAMTVLRPSGKIIINKEVHDAVSNTNFIEKGEKIIVVKFENMQLYVERL